MTKDDVGKMFEGEDEFGDYPEWTKTVDQINEQVCRIGAAAAARAAGAGFPSQSCVCPCVRALVLVRPYASPDGFRVARGSCGWRCRRWGLRRVGDTMVSRGRFTTGCGPITKGLPS